MGMVELETQSKVPPAQGSSSPSHANTKPQGSEKEMKELREALGALRDGKGPSRVPENEVAENGVGFSSSGNQGVGDEGAVDEVVKNSVVQTKVLALSENDGGQGLADSEMNGVSSLMKMRESGRSPVVSHGLDSVDASSEIIVAESYGIVSEGGSLVVGVEEGKDERKSEDAVKDVDFDGAIVTIDVPIMEISEDMDVEVEDISYEGHGFSVGDFVWGKIKSHPWWPGRIYDPSDASDLALKLKQKDRFLVAYFGDGTFAWCHPSQLKPFQENFDDMVKQSSSKTFVIAVQEAVNEIGWLLEMKMSYALAEKKTGSEFTLPLAKNSGIKEGAVVPENGIERLSFVPIEPAELLSRVKQVAETITIASILELEILKSQLSALYQSRGGYELPHYEDPLPVPGLEDKSMNETVDVDKSMSAVEAPVQGPFQDELCDSTSPVSPKLGELYNSGNRLNHRRKQKSIAEIMGKEKEVHTENKDGDATDEVMDTIGAIARRKRKGGESKPVQKRKEMLVDTNTNVLSADNDSGGGKEADEETKMKEQHEKGSSRERKKSKYLSPPFTTVRGPRKGDLETESPKVSPRVSSKAPISEGMAGDSGQLSPPILNCNGEAFQENLSNDSLNHQTHKGDENKTTINPKKVETPAEEVMFELCDAAINPQTSRESASLERFVDFISAFRSALYHEGSLYKIYNIRKPGRKRKISEPELGFLKKHETQSDHSSPTVDSEPRKKRRKKGASETKTGKKGTDENDSAAVLFVSFWPGSTLPSRSDLITLYSQFGPLNEAETDMFRTNFTGRVSFLRTSDAEKALHHSQALNPFGTSDVTFQLQHHSSAGSKSGEHGERLKSKRLSAKKKDKTPAATLPDSLPQGSCEASKLNFIKEKLQSLTSMVEAASEDDKLLPKEKLVSEMKGLLEDVSKMVESSSS